MVVLKNNKKMQEIMFNGVGHICGCRIRNDGKIEFKVMYNNQKIWVLGSQVHELSKEEDFGTR